MKNFFSSVQGKFETKDHGRYLGHILEQIAAIRVEVIAPILKAAPLRGPEGARWSSSKVRSVATEFAYCPESGKQDDGRADFMIDLDSGEETGTVLVEIKMKDSFLPGQLKRYIAWAKEREGTQEDRAVVVLTAFPIKPEESQLIKKNGDYIHHIYLSGLLDELRRQRKVEKSELIQLFSDYLTEEGYAMYQLLNDENNEDYKALLSFMAHTFLHPLAAKGKVASAKKVARGPVVFSQIIQNWQLISDRFADLNLRANRRPTIRYFPEQGAKEPKGYDQEIPNERIVEERREARKQKSGGRYWLTAQTTNDDQTRAEWGQIIQITKGKSDDADQIECSLYASILKSGAGPQLGGKIIHMKGGILDKKLYTPEDFMKELRGLMEYAQRQAKMSVLLD